MRFFLKAFGLAILAGAVSSLTAFAHHSHGNYLRTTWVHLTGTVLEVRWMNPHSWIYLEVPDDDGETAIWALEGASVTTLRQDGWAADSVEAGDEISVRCHGLLDGQNGCLLGYITLPGGEEREFD